MLFITLTTNRKVTEEEILLIEKNPNVKSAFTFFGIISGEPALYGVYIVPIFNNQQIMNEIIQNVKLLGVEVKKSIFST